MKRIPILLPTFAALGALVAVVQHVHSRQARAARERERLQLFADTHRAHAEQAQTKEQVEAARARAVAAAARTKATAHTPAPAAAAGEARAAVATPARPPVAPVEPDPEMRRVRVQTFAGEQRMQFAAVLHRLGFTPAQRQAFDRINEEFYQAMLTKSWTPRQGIRRAACAPSRCAICSAPFTRRGARPTSRPWRGGSSTESFTRPFQAPGR